LLIQKTFCDISVEKKCRTYKIFNFILNGMVAYFDILEVIKNYMVFRD